MKIFLLKGKCSQGEFKEFHILSESAGEAMIDFRKMYSFAEIQVDSIEEEKVTPFSKKELTNFKY